MQKKPTPGKDAPRWMTQCDVVRYNLKIPDDMKEKLNNEAREMGVGMSAYICGILSGDIKRKKAK